MTKYVYLAGAMTHDDDKAAWREEAARLLAPEFEVLDPVKFESKNLEPHEIVNLDYGAINRSTLVLCRAHLPSWGTAMELRYAQCAAYVDVVTFDAPDKRSPWLKAHTDHFASDLASAVALIKEYYS
jgi:hypothetical protein